MSNKIEPSSKKIGNYLTLDGKATFVIPEYQRAYSWDTTQCDQLWEDIENFIQDKEDNPYFFGTIIISCNENESELTLIDGQQRTTTFILLLKALLIKLNDSITENNKIINETKARSKNPDKELTNRNNRLKSNRQIVVKILHNLRNNQLEGFLEGENFETPNILNNRSINEVYKDELHTILQSVTFEELQKNVKTILHKKKENKYTNYFRNFKFFYKEKFAEMSDDKINNFAECILENSEIIEIRSWNIEQAIAMFNSLNASGLPLADADIISAKMHAEANTKDSKEKFDRQWQELIAIVKNIKPYRKITIDSILMQYMYILRSDEKEYITKNGSVDIATPGVRRYYTKYRADLLEKPVDLVTALLKIAKIWQKIQDYSMIRLAYAFNLNIRLYLISYLYRFDLDEIDEVLVEDFLQHLLKIFAILTVVDTGYSSAKFKSFLFRLNVKLVDKNVNLYQIKKDIQEHIENQWGKEKDEIEKQINEYYRNNLVYLFEYIFCLQTKQKFVLRENYSVEHIMPQSGQNIKQIRKDANIQDDKEFTEKLNKLGNKIVLEAKMNTNLGNAWFRTKCEEYQKSEYKVTRSIPKEYGKGNMPLWKKENIDERTEKMTKDILNFLFS